MENLIKNWTFKKHCAAIGLLYGTIHLIGCLFFMNKKSKYDLKKRKEKHSHKMFHGIAAACSLIDLCSYPVIIHMRKKLD